MQRKIIDGRMIDLDEIIYVSAVTYSSYIIQFRSGYQLSYYDKMSDSNAHGRHLPHEELLNLLMKRQDEIDEEIEDPPSVKGFYPIRK